jgi:hypothetical protein
LRTLVAILRPALRGREPSISLEHVSPRPRDEARPGTFSAVHGLGPFPLHTERAHWRTPPRFVALRSIGAPSPRATTLLDSSLLAQDAELLSGPSAAEWIVAAPDSSFRARVLQRIDADQAWIVRFDPLCMFHCDLASEALARRLEHALQALPPVEFHWSQGIALVVDNWRTLHGRGPAPVADRNRILERIVFP